MLQGVNASAKKVLSQSQWPNNINIASEENKGRWLWKLFARCSVFLSRIKDKIWLIPSLQLYFQSERERF